MARRDARYRLVSRLPESSSTLNGTDGRNSSSEDALVGNQPHCHLADGDVSERFAPWRGGAPSEKPLCRRLGSLLSTPIFPFRSAAKEICIPCAKSNLNSVFHVSGAGSAGFYLASYFGELAGMAAPSMQPAREIFDLLLRGIDFAQRSPATLKALTHFETELCRILGVQDPSGRVTAVDALASLYGTIPATRALALKLLV